MEGRRVKNQEKWQRLIGKYEKSGQKIGAFCEKHQIKTYSFQYWRRKLSGPVKEEAGSFVALHSRQPGSCIFIRCQNGLELELPGDYPAESLGELIRSLSC